MDKKIVTKILATILAFTLTFANVVLIGIYTQEVHAASVNLEEQDTAVAKANIEFDSYFLDEEEIKHSKDINIRESTDKLYLKLKVADGYLSNASIKIENANFKLANIEEELELVQSIDVENNIIMLNQIDKGESVTLELPIIMNTDSDYNIENFNKVSSIILDGIYVNNKAKETRVSKTIEVSANITAEAEAKLTQEISKYVQFDVNGRKGVILQTSIKSNLVDNILPVKQTEIEIEIPKINGVIPEKVSLSATSTEATNGKGEKVFVSGRDYTYENGKVTLLIENEQKENGTISWMKNSQDEILLTCVYGENAKVESTELNLIANSKITTYNNQSLFINGASNEKVELKEEKGQIVTFDMEMSKEKFEKGQMLVKGATNTSYVETWKANVGYSELVGKIILNSQMNYLDENKNNYVANTLYTYTKISQENLIEILGEEGYINIYNQNGEKITTINKDNLEYKYETETPYIIVETSNVKSEGILKIENGREIISGQYEREQTMLFKQMEAKLNAVVMCEEKSLIRPVISKEMDLIEPKTSIETYINKTNLSTVEKNDGVEIKVVLNTNDPENSLYKNPKILIEFPSYIEGISEGKIGLLYNDELKLGKTTIYRNEIGNSIIEIPMTGEQTAFNTSSVSNGATIIIYANLNVNELTPAIEDSIKVFVTNENPSIYDVEENGMGLSKINIKYAAQNKLITRNTIYGYNKNDEVRSLDSNNTATIIPKSEAKSATVKLDIVNSTSKDITNISILGRTPFAGNKSVISSQDLNSKFTAKMINQISITYGINRDEIKIYYSNNENANRNLNDTKNGWTENPSNINEVKSYLIVLGDRVIPFGDRISFEYGVQIPENLDEEIGTYSTFAVYYAEIEKQEEPQVMLMSEETTVEPKLIEKTQEANSVGLVTDKIEDIPANNNTQNGNQSQTSTENTPQENLTPFTQDDIEVKVETTSSGQAISNNSSVKEGQYVDYTVSMTNKSGKDLVFDLEVSKENATFYRISCSRYNTYRR